MGARSYKQSTIKRLYALSGNLCAFSRCMVTSLSFENNDNLSNICHIEDANKGGRYNPNMTDIQRADYENLILLCPTHHEEIDDTDRYPVERLKQMKREHEAKMLRHSLDQNLIVKHPKGQCKRTRLKKL